MMNNSFIAEDKGGVVPQSVEWAASGQEVMGLISAVGACFLLVWLVSV